MPDFVHLCAQIRPDLRGKLLSGAELRASVHTLKGVDPATWVHLPPSWDRFLTYMAHTMSASSRRAIQAVLSARCIRCNIMQASTLAAFRLVEHRRYGRGFSLINLINRRF